MAKMLGQDLFTQTEFDKFKQELEVTMQQQADELKKIKRIISVFFIVASVTALALVAYHLVS